MGTKIFRDKVVYIKFCRKHTFVLSEIAVKQNTSHVHKNTRAVLWITNTLFESSDGTKGFSKTLKRIVKLYRSLGLVNRFLDLLNLISRIALCKLRERIVIREREKEMQSENELCKSMERMAIRENELCITAIRGTRGLQSKRKKTRVV